MAAQKRGELNMDPAELPAPAPGPSPFGVGGQKRAHSTPRGEGKVRPCLRTQPGP